MAKSESRNKPSGRRAAREAGRFAIGRAAFGKISEVEGITVSRKLEGDLRRLDRVSPERRRAVLARKYGKK
jgi:hypothetical protein